MVAQHSHVSLSLRIDKSHWQKQQQKLRHCYDSQNLKWQEQKKKQPGHKELSYLNKITHKRSYPCSFMVQPHSSNVLKILAKNIVNGSLPLLKESPYASLQTPIKRFTVMLFASKWKTVCWSWRPQVKDIQFRFECLNSAVIGTCPISPPNAEPLLILLAKNACNNEKPKAVSQVCESNANLMNIFQLFFMVLWFWFGFSFFLV